MLPEEEQMIREDCWVEVTKKMPIPCVDVIVCRSQKFLMGWRIIPPYKNVWALPGGRMFRGESFIQTAMRQCAKSALKIRNLCCIGLYPVRFPSRHDITACVVAQWESGTPVPTNEFSRYTWFGACEIREIRPIGANYRKMLQDWQGTSVRWSTKGIRERTNHTRTLDGTLLNGIHRWKAMSAARQSIDRLAPP